MRRLSAIAAIAGTSLLLLACGGDDKNSGGGGGGSNGAGKTVSASSYVDVVCTSLSSWAKSIQKAQTGITAQASATPAQGKKLLKDFFSAVITTTSTFADSLANAGIPDVEQGKEASEALTKLGTNATARLETVRKQIDDLPTNDAGAFVKGSTKVQTDVAKAFADVTTELSTAFTSLESKDLDKAFSESKACKAL